METHPGWEVMSDSDDSGDDSQDDDGMLLFYSMYYVHCFGLKDMMMSGVLVSSDATILALKSRRQVPILKDIHRYLLTKECIDRGIHCVMKLNRW